MDDKTDMKGESQKPAIRVSEETKDRIANFGKAGESLETALIRALDIAEKHKEG
jgi:predicted DNA-binding protein